MINKDQILALSGIFQAAKLVEQVAHHGRFDSESAEELIYSLFQYDAATTTDVFGGEGKLSAGHRELEKQLRTPDKNEMEVPHMVMAMVVLSKKLLKAETRLQEMRNELERVESKLEFYDLSHTNMLSSLAEIYKMYISDLSPRIMVKGDPMHLENPDNQNRIRTLLLAGIRSAILWIQLGGSRFQLLFKRKQLLAVLEAH